MKKILFCILLLLISTVSAYADIVIDEPVSLIGRNPILSDRFSERTANYIEERNISRVEVKNCRSLKNTVATMCEIVIGNKVYNKRINPFEYNSRLSVQQIFDKEIDFQLNKLAREAMPKARLTNYTRINRNSTVILPIDRTTLRTSTNLAQQVGTLQ